MKTFKILFAFIATIVLFAACGDKGEPAAEPTITFGSTSPQVIGEGNFPYDVNLAVTIKAEGKIKTITVDRFDGDGTGTRNAAKSEELTKKVDGDKGETNFPFTIVDKIETAMKVRYQVTVLDQTSEGQTVSKDFVFQVSDNPPDLYTFTFSCAVNGTDIAITETGDSKVVANGIATFKLEVGTYNYTATKDEYESATGTITVTTNEESNTKEIVMTPINTDTPLTAWSADIVMGMKNQSWGTHPTNAGEAYGFEYKTNGDGSNMHIEAVSGAQFVEVAATVTIETQEALIDEYTKGTKTSTIMQPFNPGAKTFASKMFISKVGDKYYLIKTTAADQHHSAAPGSFIKFQERH